MSISTYYSCCEDSLLFLFLLSLLSLSVPASKKQRRGKTYSTPDTDPSRFNHAWRNFRTNPFSGDELSEEPQLWTYLYSTGRPVLSSPISPNMLVHGTGEGKRVGVGGVRLEYVALRLCAVSIVTIPWHTWVRAVLVRPCERDGERPHARVGDI